MSYIKNNYRFFIILVVSTIINVFLINTSLNGSKIFINPKDFLVLNLLFGFLGLFFAHYLVNNNKETIKLFLKEDTFKIIIMFLSVAAGFLFYTAFILGDVSSK